MTLENILGFFTTQRRVIQSLILLVFCMGFGVLTLSNPILEWDMIAYVGNAKKLNADVSGEQLREAVYSDLKKSVPTEDYERLIGTPSRLIISQDDDAFEQTIAFFYDARVIYISLLAVLMKGGMDPFYASYFISTVCTILSILLLATMVPRPLPYGLCLALPFIVLSNGLLEVARFSTPDALATLITVCLYWCLMRRSYLLFILFPLSIFVRTDLILLVPLFLAYLYMEKHFARAWLFIAGLMTLAAYVILNHWIVEADAWSSLIGYNYGNKPTHPEGFTFTVTLSEYISYVISGLRGFSYQSSFFMFCALAITGVYLTVPKLFHKQEFTNFRLSRDLLFLIVSSVVYFSLHFALFPQPWIRFNAAQYSLVAVGTLWVTMILAAEHRAFKGGLD